MPNKRIQFVVLLMGLSFAAVFCVRSGYQFSVMQPPLDLESIPLAFESWRGEDIEVQQETLGVLSASSYIQRRYTDLIGREVSLHAAIWGTVEEVGIAAPHHPEICYPSANWTIMDRQIVEVTTDQAVIPLELIHFQRQSSSLITAHWYRMGDYFFTRRQEARKKLISLWGTKAWPCTEKYLLQTNQDDIETAWPLLSKFAKDLLSTLDPSLTDVALNKSKSHSMKSVSPKSPEGFCGIRSPRDSPL